MRNTEQARFNMVEQQIRPWDVHDAQLLDLLIKIKREQFVPAEHRSLAFMDLEIPLGHGVSMWSPKIEARAVQALQLKSSDQVLEVGTGSGYLTALLANLAAHVTSVEQLPELAAKAAQLLSDHHVANVSIETGDAAQGWGTQSFDAILLAGSVPLPPEALLRQLKVGGRLFAVVGHNAAMQATLFNRVSAEAIEQRVLFETHLAPLENTPQPQHFVF